MRPSHWSMLVGLLLLPYAQGALNDQSASMAAILERYREILLRGSAPNADEVNGWLRTFDASTGQWPDIEYHADSPSLWEPLAHLSRARSLSHAWAEEPESADAEAILATCRSALDHWNAHRYQCRNWWFNEIGVPRLMRDILVLLKGVLPAETRTGAIAVLAQLNVRGTGANLTWSAELSLHHACLTGHVAQLSEAAKLIWDEVSVGQREGIQEDWSYFQHGPRLQAHHYGIAYVSQVCLTAWQLHGTPWAMPPDKREIMDQYLTKGLFWMSRGGFNSPGTVDRKASRMLGLNEVEAMRIPLTLWGEVSPSIQPLMVDWVSAIDGAQIAGVSGFKHFPIADFSVFHRPRGSIFLKTISDRTHLTESINYENRKGVPFLNCGDHYLICNGAEYVGLPPVWDWARLPGLTTSNARTGPERTSFVGGLGNGASGLTAMDYRRRGTAGTFQMRKLWIFHGDTMLCLLGPVKGAVGTGPFVTAVEQCRLQGPVDYVAFETQDHKRTETAENLSAISVDHHGVRYASLDGQPLRLNAGIASGNWAAINGALSAETVSVPVLRLEMVQASNVPLSGYAIHFEPSKTPAWEILQNDDRAQVVRFADGTVFAAFYEPSEGPALPLQVSRACLALLGDGSLWLSDPTHAGLTLDVSIDRRQRTVTLPAKGFGLRLDP